jgi:predicted phosphoribosyltransferase
MPFANRPEAGRRLAAALDAYKAEGLVTLTLPRGGVPVAAEITSALKAPLDLILARKIGVPFAPELAMGAVVDDGIATGATMRAALCATRVRGPRKLILAVPVAPSDTLDALRLEADEVVCLEEPQFFGGIGEFYSDFHQMSDDEVIETLKPFVDLPAADLQAG